MTILATFLANAGLAFALSLILAALLGPDAFGRYALGLSIAIVINTLLFEWLKLSTTRFQSDRAQRETPEIRRTLDLAYWASGGGLALLVLAALMIEPANGLSRAMLVAAAACGLAYGFCEYRMALSRALFQSRSWVTLSFSRAFFGFLLAAGAAWATRDPALALAGTALAAFLPIVLVQRALRAPEAGVFDPRALSVFARYALPLIAANALYQLMPLLNRGLLASRDGFVEAGYFSLVSELATRLFQNLGTALDILLFQLAVRAEEQHGREAAERQISANAAIVTAIVLPSAAGLWVVWPSFEALFIPESFKGHLAPSVPYLIPALATYALIQFAVNPFFQLRHRTWPVVTAALTAIVVNLVAVAAWPALPGAEGVALGQLAGLAAGLAVLLGRALAAGARMRWRDLTVSAAAAGLMMVALLPLRDLGSPILTLVVQVLAGVGLYGILALAFDLCGCRAFLNAALGRRPVAQTERLR